MRFLIFISLPLIFNLYYQNRIVLILCHEMIMFILTAINNVMLINKKESSYIFFLKICWNSFYFSIYGSINSSQVITESSMILAKYFPFSQLDVTGSQTWSFSHIRSSVIFGIHTLLDRLLIVLQLPAHLSNLDSNCKWIVIKFLIVFIRM